MKQILAAALTGLLLVAALWGGRRNDSFASAGAPDPETCVERMFNSAADGNVDGFRNCFTGEQQRSLDRELTGQSMDAFRKSMMESATTLKGRSREILSVDQSNGRAEIAVERVYAHRHDRQILRLCREKDGWRIESARAVASFQPPVAYGTPVVPNLPKSGPAGENNPGQEENPEP